LDVGVVHVLDPLNELSGVFIDLLVVLIFPDEDLQMLKVVDLVIDVMCTDLSIKMASETCCWHFLRYPISLLVI
jgi:hypothetical protein